MSIPEYPDEMAWIVAEADGTNEDVLRYEIESGKHVSSPLRLAAAKVSLAKREDARALAASDKRDAREEETLSIAREANRIAESAAATAAFAASTATDALRIAKHERTATVIAAIAAIVAAIAAMYTLIISYHSKS